MANEQSEKGFPLDRLSNLPCSVVDHILKYLPFRDVAKSSILHTEWRYRWRTCPYLVFDRRLLMSLTMHCHSPELVVYRTLVLHKGPIIKFLFHYGRQCGATANDLDCWLHLLSNHNVEDLTLTLSRLHMGRLYVMPHCFFSFDHLTRLTLYKVAIQTPRDFKGFNKLVELHLKDIRIELGHFRAFLSKCPMLEVLTMHKCNETPWCLDVEAPNLKRFAFLGVLCSIHLQSSCLKELWIEYIGDSYLHENYLPEFSGVNIEEGNLIKVFGKLPTVKSLCLERFVLQFIAKVGVPQKPKNFNGLADLMLNDIPFVEKDVVILVLRLIKSSPNLQRLCIDCGDNWGMDKEDKAIEHVKGQQDCRVALRCLKSVKINKFRGLKCEVEFVKLLLRWATTLEKLEIKYRIDGHSFDGSIGKKIKALKEVTSFPRASTHAAIIFR